MNLWGIEMGFGSLLGLYAFAFLIPFILIYLVRPKRLTKTIPSLMFFLKEDKKSRQSSFLQKLMSNIIFFLQLLAILLLAFSVMNPYIKAEDKSTIKNTYIIIDASASMQTKDRDQTRFDKAIDIARQNLAGNINILLAYRNEVRVPVRDGWTHEARSKLSTFQASDGSANIESAMQKADQLLDKKNARIVVISDFINTLGSYDDPLKAKRILTSKGNKVEFIDLSSPASNAGIVQIIPRMTDTQVYVKNFDHEKKTIKLEVKQDNKELFEETRNIMADSVEVFTFETPVGQSNIILSPDDDFTLDNRGYLSTPPEKKVKVLLLTSSSDSFLMSALKASSLVDLEVKVPPFTIEQVRNINPQIIITNELNTDEIVVGDFEGIAELASEGKIVIITAQEDMDKIDFNSLVPMHIKGLGEVTMVNRIIENQFTKDLEFGAVDKYVKGEKINGSTTILAADDGTPLLSFLGTNNSVVIYYGILDKYSDFKSTPAYPIFWDSLLRYILKTDDIRDYNKRTGDTLAFEKAGFLTYEGKKIALNLMDEKESDVGNQHEDFTEESNEFVVELKEKTREIPLEIYLIAAALIMLFLEILVIKKRGDL